MPSFSQSSKDKLATCESDLQKLFNEVIKTRDCTILEGHRDMERQKELFREGKTTTLGSRHLSSPSAAVDVMPYPIDWDDRLGQHEFATFVYDTAMKLGVSVNWGGSWKTFYDAPHWQCRGSYEEGCGNDVG